MSEHAIPVRMVRDADQFPDSHEALVTPDGVPDFEAFGWSVADHAAEKKPRAKKAKGDTADLIAAVESILDPLDRPNDYANGLTLRQLRADIAGLGLDVDPDMSPADLLALRDLHREEQAAGL